MNIIVGATGQVGSNLLKELSGNGFPVRAVVRDPGKLVDRTVEAKVADLFDVEQLTAAFQGGTTVFVQTPEDPTSNDIIGETEYIVENYRKAIQTTGIKKVVALSCIGAHIEGDTGNILMSRILEQGISTLPIDKVFIRPSYYFSNWLGYRQTIEQYGVLPTFFPEQLKIEMHSPVDLARFIAEAMAAEPAEGSVVYELIGERPYSPRDVADAFSHVFKKAVAVQPIPREKWEETLLSVGFTQNTAANLADMTQAVIDGRTMPERPNDVIKLPTSLEQYLHDQLDSEV